MKKIFYLAAILLTFIGCTTNHTTTPTNIQVDHIDYITIDEYRTISVYNIEYNGHEYLWLDGHESIGIEHNPDCPCNKQNSEYQSSEYLY